jgi:hypothetical protein
MRTVHSRHLASIRLAIGALTVGTLLLVPRSGQVHAAGGVVLRAHFVVGHHYSKVETQTTTTKVVIHAKDGKGNVTTRTQNSVEVDVTPSTTTVTQVLSNGSAMMRVTYGTCMVTIDGKVEKSAMTGFYEEKQVSNTLHVISAKYVGGKGIPADILNTVTSGDSVKVTKGTDGYPATPVQVGSSWTAVGTIPSFGSITLRTTVLALGTQNGRPTVTARQTVNQPVTFTGGGFIYKGQFVIGQTQMSYVDDGSDARPTTDDNLSFKGTFTDKTGANTGTLTISGTDHTVPSA